MAKKLKGISLPIDMLVILAIAVVVLIAVIAVFMGVFPQFGDCQKKTADYSSACMPWVNSGCNGNPPDSVCTAADAAKGCLFEKGDARVCIDQAGKDAAKRACRCPV